jgi:hypothetical protein
MWESGRHQTSYEEVMIEERVENVRREKNMNETSTMN